MSNRKKKHLLLIDHHPYWREISTNILRKNGFLVNTLDTHEYTSSCTTLEGDDPDLVLLGCPRIRSEEEQVINDLLTNRRRLLILCTSLSWDTMRHLFLKGVEDIVDKPYNPIHLVKIVNQTLDMHDTQVNKQE